MARVRYMVMIGFWSFWSLIAHSTCKTLQIRKIDPSLEYQIVVLKPPSAAPAANAAATTVAAAVVVGSKLSSFRFIIWMLHIGWKKCHQIY